MQFELTGALLDDILFCMENQDGAFVLDSFEGIVVNSADDNFEKDDAADTGRFLSLPEWGPADGFRLMERFAAALHNPLAREELSAALDRGRGVFRAFKDALARFPEIEKRWFNYKAREMKREIIAWYNGLRESWGLELIGEEPEDIDALVLEDFRFRDGSPADSAAAAELHRICLEQGRNDSDEGKKLAAETLAAMSEWVFPGDRCLVAESAGGDFAACACGAFTALGCLHVSVLEVKPEYRGLGLGGALLSRLLEKTGGAFRVSIDVPAGAEHFTRVLARESFKPCVQRFCFTGLPVQGAQLRKH